jgi:hypothetical protein
VLTLGLYGCGSTSDTGQSSTQEKSAKVNFNVTFPPKNAVKSLIPQGTAYVDVYWSVYDMTSGSSAWGNLTIYPDATTNTGKATAEMVPGFYVIGADCYDVNGTRLSSAYNYAQVGSGSNDIVITFIQGRWTFVNASGVATPIGLSGGESLSSIDITSYGDDTYPITWNLSNGTSLSSYLLYRSFSGDVSQLLLYASALGLPGNVSSTTTRIDAFDAFYNFTNPSQTTRSGEVEGDRVIMFASVHPSLMEGQYGATVPTSTPDVNQYFNTQLVSGTKLTGTIIDYTVGPQTALTDTGVACTPSYYQQQPVVKLANKVSNMAVKSSQVGTVTETSTMCEYSSTSMATGIPTFTQWQTTRTYTNVNVYPFTAVGADTPKTILVKR